MPIDLGTITSSTTAGTVVWTIWNAASTATLTTTTATIDVWAAWVVTTAGTASNASIITTTTTTAATIWPAWNLGYVTREQVRATFARASPSPEEVQAQLRAQERWRAEHVRIQAERSQAEARAEKLLAEVLSPAQREELVAKKYFTVESIAKNGERRIYQVHRGRSRNVVQVDASGRRIKTLCAHPTALVPDADTMVAQKLMLEGCEEDFLRVANHS